MDCNLTQPSGSNYSRRMARLEHVIARNVAELREEHGATQSELAAKMRANGFNWQTNRVAQLETLRRPVSLLEVVGLSYVFGVDVGRLLAGGEDVDLPDGSTLPLERVRNALAGKGPAFTIREATPEELQEHKTSVDDLRKIAKRLSVPPNVVDAAAYRVFGQSLRAEREQRLGDVSGLSAGAAQTKRGHVTRGLVAALDEWLQAGGREQLESDIAKARGDA